MTTENQTENQAAGTDAAKGSATAPTTESTSTESAAESAAESGPDLDAIRAEMKRDRFDAAAARAGVDEGYVDAALALFDQCGKEPTKENMSAFIAELKKSKPALFGPQPANTAPAPATSAPSTPAPGGAASPHQQWRALLDAGRKAEAEAFYLQNLDEIRRSA